ncbi:siroheme decarboxylase subunit alpha [Pelorhabdus rhamnosifermentans]|uniref:siroheme decarboxylase subunit alpha n=1 Tax=Pelorhabdus rhamnosifermentans TaxID=2772457 RepID=UPI001C06247B|nr:Lrp/AsnC family transcriptional regulator [Pelorhabdus rhamnosifermentans]
MLTPLDKSILNIIQTRFPVAKRPFAVIAQIIGSEEKTVLTRIKWMKEKGLIRRIGPFFDSKKLGYCGTLVAVDVDPIYIQQVAEAINSYPGVTHNYEREGPFNLWFTLLSPNQEAQDRILHEIQILTGIQRMVNLPATNKIKVNVEFTLK